MDWFLTLHSLYSREITRGTGRSHIPKVLEHSATMVTQLRIIGRTSRYPIQKSLKLEKDTPSYDTEKRVDIDSLPREDTATRVFQGKPV